MDSTGLHRLVAAQHRLLQRGRRLALVRGGEQVQRLFELTGVGELMTMVDSPGELLETARRRAPPKAPPEINCADGRASRRATSRSRRAR